MEPVPLKFERPLNRGQVAKMLADRRKSFALRTEAQANHIFLQREMRRRILASLRQAEQQHIGQNTSSMGDSSEYLTRMRREMLLASLGR